ncbi:hypothetical protein ACHAQJ_007609 [Trichoderma viride]
MDLKLSEPQMVQQYELDSFVYVWAVLDSFIKHGNAAVVIDGEMAVELAVPVTPQETAQKARVSYQVEFGSSSSDYHNRPPSSDSHLSVGYVEELDAPLFKDATVRLVNCITRVQAGIQDSCNCVPIVSDELLGQMVGEVLALRSISRDEISETE